MTRKTFQRLSEDARRKELLDATLDVIADHGLHAASVRKIAEKAGVSAGLIRHFFQSDDDLVRAAYAYLIGMLTGQASEKAEAQNGTPESRLAAFVAGNLSKPNLSSFKVSIWATFIVVVRSGPEFARIHRDSDQEFLDILQSLIAPVLAQHARALPDADCRKLAIALNGLIDGLWLEGSLEHGLYDPETLAEIALSAAENLLQLPPDTLGRHLDPGTKG